MPHGGEAARYTSARTQTSIAQWTEPHVSTVCGQGFESSWGCMSIHELTGREYLGVTMRGPRFHPALSNWFFHKRTDTPDGEFPAYWEPRWTMKPFHWLFRLRRKLTPLLCRVG